MSERTLHLMRTDGRWEVTEEGLFEVLADFDDRGEAEAWAREEADRLAARLVVHAESYGGDGG